MATDVLNFFCQHLIGIGWYEGIVNEDGDFTERPTCFGASGFLLQLHEDIPESLALVTAGHVFTDHKENMSKPNMGTKSVCLFDIWGPDSMCDIPIPFDFFNEPIISSVLAVEDKEEGYDFAVIPLPNFVASLLRQTTKPFTKANWIHQPNIEFDFYAMVGLPNEYAEQTIERQGNTDTITTIQSPALLHLDPCELPDFISSASNPQFIARINPLANMNDITGMSGGPIFGFRKNEDGRLAYWPVAIQNRWWTPSQIVIGTLIAPVAAMIERGIEDFIAVNCV